LSGPLLVTLPEPRRLELAAEPELHELDELAVALEHGFHLDGRVLVDPDWVQRLRLDPYVLELHVPAEPSVSPSAEFTQPIDTRRGEFRWTCSTPRAPLRLSVVFSSQAGERLSRELLVEPRDGRSEDVVVRFP
jgi:hypothetical protein